MNSSIYSTGNSVAAINVQFLSAALCGAVAWWAWPSTPEWWHLGVLSVLMWFACATAIIKALRLVVRLWSRTRAISAFNAQGQAPKSSAMATDEQLEAKGMFDE